MREAKYKISSEVLEVGLNLGYSRQTLPLLFIVPLVQVAWAEGFLQAGERKTILHFAENFHANNGHTDFGKLFEWLSERPSDDFFDESLEDLQELLDSISSEQAVYLRNILQNGCLEVANAAGAIGLVREPSAIHREERKLIHKIGERLALNIAPDLP